MKSLQLAVFVSFVTLGAATAQAQFGLYGSPERLNLSQPDPASVPYGSLATPAYYPAPWTAPPTQAAPSRPYAAVPWPQYSGTPAVPTPPHSAAPPHGFAPIPAPNHHPHAPGGYETRGHSEPTPYGGCATCGMPIGQCGCLSQSVADFEDAACGGYDYACAPRSCCPWYASVSALVMGRNDANRLWTSYEWQNDSNQEEHSRFALRWRWGGEVRVGRRFCCDTWAVEAAYWTLDMFEGSRVTSHPNGIATPLTVGNVFFAGYPGTQWFDGALEHRLHRTNEFHNAEVNVIRRQLVGAGQLPWDVDFSFGVRYFRFEENLVFSSVANPTRMTDPSLNREAFLDERVENNLFGFQFGIGANYYLASRCRVFVTPRFGIYSNHISHRFHAYLGDGTAATQYEYPGRGYPVVSSKDVFSFMTQIDAGLEWGFWDNWSVRVGYRVLAATGIGLADNQIPHFIVDIPEIADVDHNGELILHGAFFGIAYNF